MIKVMSTKLPGPVLVEGDLHRDDRGCFRELWNQRSFAAEGLDLTFVQDNLAFSRRRTLRGLHFQNPKTQGKLVSVLHGEVFDVVVDIRDGSPTFGQWIGVVLSAEINRQLYVPPGFAHGFCVTSDTALLAYKCTDFYCPEAEGAILWNDPDIGIRWPIDRPVLSERDRCAPHLKDVPRERLTFSAGAG